MLHFFIVFMLAVSVPPVVCSSAANGSSNLKEGQELSGGNRLISKNGKFALGFFTSGSSKSSSDNTTLPNWYVGIWFNKIPKFTPVWIANREKPITDPKFRLSKLRISRDGNLVILNHATKSIIWSSQIIAAKGRRTANKNTTIMAALSDDGNLVIRNALNPSIVWWQSFDHPTDVFLPGARIGRNKVTGQKYSLVSKKNLIDPAPGLYCTELDPTGDPQYFVRICNSSMVYFSTGEWVGWYFNLVPEMSGSNFLQTKFIDNDEEEYFTYAPMDPTVITIGLLDVSGLTKQLLWLEGLQEWETIYVQPRAPCDVFAVCGPFTVCNDNTLPLCNCMNGFSVKSPDDWELDDRRGGCMRNTPLEHCSSNKGNTRGLTDQFFPIHSVRLPYYAHRMETIESGQSCMQVCLRNCSCTAYSYGKSGCSIWQGQLINVKQYNNGTVNSDGEILLLRIAAGEVQSWGNNTKGNRRMITGLIVGPFCLLVMLLMIWRGKRKWCSLPLSSTEGGCGVIAFKYVDLQHATKNFSEKLGVGGFGSVFKGILRDSTTIAVKMLDGARQGEKQFRAEVSTIGMIQHVNLVKLIGFCCEGDRRMLVYEHMANRSLDVHIFRGNGFMLDWSTRFRIAIGVAKGLSYLHESCRDCIIHCDIKPENILLDASLVPKIADFGMAKLMGRNFSRVLTTMRGTVGYLAPEWISGVAITQKVDVYSYGMVLLEMISGRRNSSPQECTSNSDHDVYFPVQAALKLLEGDVRTLVDQQLHGDINVEEVERACKAACWCIQDHDFDRPTMGDVVQVLEGLVELDMPRVPRLLQAISGSPSTN
ncbi:unnamed protein product [Triticum turgidum subsp. durum]|uniref:Receptor-like serine/threonine-protein kinase n=1 Tax=Triticum turgidum subsp. durum TaxID=4567 RepID=A0A9R1R0S7_TRITD|nr:unnamed protein product [Triticum turgidum subsp. durum]